MLPSLTLLLSFQLAGEIIAGLLDLPIPGPVLGMAFLFITLQVKGGPSEGLKVTSNGLLQHLSLLFIPAGTGILMHMHRLAEDWLPLTLSVLISTMLSMAVTALIIQGMDRHAGKAQTEAQGD